MPDDSHHLETGLRAQSAASLEPSLLDRLEAAADGTLAQLTPLEKQFEAELKACRPSALSDALIASLEATTQGVAFPTEDSVVHFRAHPTQAGKRTNQRTWWRSAAAVALLGAMAGLLSPATKQEPATAKQEPVPHAMPANPNAPSITTLTPAEFSRKLSETSDEGVIWPSNAQPHRVLKVVYKDMVTLKRADGSTYQVEQPRVEYYVVPMDSD